MAQQFTTGQLSDLLNVQPKTLRGYLRKHYAKKHVRGSVWRISSQTLEELRSHFG